MPFLLSITLILFFNFSYAGSFAGNGSDIFLKNIRKAWFIDKDKSFSICAKVNPQFPLNHRLSQLAIEGALNKWVNYIEKRNIGAIFESQKRLSTKFHWETSCDKNTDLKFLFGIENAQVKKDRGMYIEPVAFAAKTEIGVWSRGYIWLSLKGTRNWPINWNNPLLMNGILLHEIGHVFGNSHIANTIMNENLKSLWDSGRSDLFWNIDGDEYLYLCPKCDFDEKIEVNSSIPNYYKTIEELLKRPIKGKLYRRLKSNLNGEKLVFTIKDSQGELKIDLHFTSHISIVNRDEIFISEQSISRLATSKIFTGIVNGKSQNFILNLNSGSRANLSLLRENGNTNSIFETRTVGIRY